MKIKNLSGVLCYTKTRKEVSIIKQFSMLEMSQLLGIPKSTLYKWLRDNGKKPSEVEKSGKQLYSEDVYFDVQEAFNKQSSRNDSQNKNTQGTDTETLINTLRQQLEQKDKQIDSLQQIVKQSQALQLTAERKLKELSDGSDKTGTYVNGDFAEQEDSTSTNQNVNNDKERKEPAQNSKHVRKTKRKGFFSSLFRNN